MNIIKDDGVTVSGTYMYRVDYGDFSVQIEALIELTDEELINIANIQIANDQIDNNQIGVTT